MLKPIVPRTKRIDAIIAMRFGLSSTILPKIAAPNPKQKIIKVKPISAANFEISKHCMILAEYWEKL